MRLLQTLSITRFYLTMDYFTRLFYAIKGVPETREIYLAKSLDEKRSLYKCKDAYVQLKDIDTWPEYHKAQKINSDNSENKVGKVFELDESLNSKIGIFTGDITCLEIDSIVNAANNRCLGGGGVDGAIHRAAGGLLYDECKTLHGCKTGEAKITAGYNLPAKYVIHTVGPMGYHPDELRNAYLNSLLLAIENNCRTIAFPCISTGVYGYPNEKAAMEVSKLLREFLQDNSDKFDMIILCLFMDKDIDLYAEYLPIFFPLPTSPTSSESCYAVKTVVTPPELKPDDDSDKPVLNLVPQEL